MKKMLLVSLLLSGMQAMAMSMEQMQTLKTIAQCCIVGCEGARAFIKKARVAYIPQDSQYDSIRKSLTCFNVCTVCAVGCCLVNEPVGACIGCGCSVIGCCVDESLLSKHATAFNNSLEEINDLKDSNFRSTSALDQLYKK